MKSLWSKEQRAISYQDVWGRGFDFGGASSAAGVTVNPDTALGLSAVLRCVRLLADTVSSLPAHAYRSTGETRQRVPNQPQILTSPSIALPREDWLQQAMVSLLLWGNAYGVIVSRDRLGFATSAEWIRPDTVTVERRSSLDLPTYRSSGTLIPSEDVIHVRGMLRPGTVEGSAPLSMSKDMIGLGIAAQKFGAEWFGDGAHPSALLMSDQQIGEEAAKTIKARFLAAVKGREPLVTGAGLKYQAVQVAADESQFLETQQAIVSDVARAFGVPAEMIGGSAGGNSVTYANREQSAIDFLTFSVNPWLVRLEAALSRQLPSGQFVKFNPDALLRTDTKTRYEAHMLALKGHFATIDEVRQLEDRPPLDNGEQFPPSSPTSTEVTP